MNCSMSYYDDEKGGEELFGKYQGAFDVFCWVALIASVAYFTWQMFRI